MGIRGYFEGVDPFVDIDLQNSAEPTKVLVDTGFTGELMLQRQNISTSATGRLIVTFKRGERL